MNRTLAFVALFGLLLVPSIVSAQITAGEQVVQGYIRAIVTTIINPLIGLLFAAATVIGLWGGVQFILNADNEEARKKGKQALVWAIIGFFIMFSVGGILNVAAGTFGISLPAGQGVERNP